MLPRLDPGQQAPREPQALPPVSAEATSLCGADSAASVPSHGRCGVGGSRDGHHSPVPLSRTKLASKAEKNTPGKIKTKWPPSRFGPKRWWWHGVLPGSCRQRGCGAPPAARWGSQAANPVPLPELGRLVIPMAHRQKADQKYGVYLLCAHGQHRGQRTQGGWGQGLAGSESVGLGAAAGHVDAGRGEGRELLTYFSLGPLPCAGRVRSPLPALTVPAPVGRCPSHPLPWHSAALLPPRWGGRGASPGAIRPQVGLAPPRADPPAFRLFIMSVHGCSTTRSRCLSPSRPNHKIQARSCSESGCRQHYPSSSCSLVGYKGWV